MYHVEALIGEGSNENLCKCFKSHDKMAALSIYEPPRGKTNNVVSEQVRHKPVCTVTEKSWKLEISDLSRRGIVLSE